jgi:hypothetical protein
VRRRAFIALLDGVAAWPLAARSQQGERVRCNRRAYAACATQSGRPLRIAALLQELRLAGRATAGGKNNFLRPGAARTPQLKRDLLCDTPQGMMAYQETFVQRDQHRDLATLTICAR